MSNKIYKSSPKADGYTLMADFDHSATMLLWPFRRDVWINPESAQSLHLEFIKKLSVYERVYLGVPEGEEEKLKGLNMPNVTVLTIPQNDAWIRDSGPLFVKNGEDVRMVKDDFNAWGGLYDDFTEDLKITPRLSEIFGCGYYVNDFILEGGNITTDGKGTAVLVANCIDNKNRNKEGRKVLEKKLKEGLGLNKVVWLEQGFVDDETDGHVDNVCRFLPDGSVVICWTDDENHPMYSRCRIIEEEIKRQSDIKIKKLPLPPATYRGYEEEIKCDGAKQRLGDELLTASYINYYLARGAVFVPQFGVREDEIALDWFRRELPGTDVVPLQTREYILSGGCLHCLTLGTNFKEIIK